MQGNRPRQETRQGTGRMMRKNQRNQRNRRISAKFNEIQGKIQGKIQGAKQGTGPR